MPQQYGAPIVGPPSYAPPSMGPPGGMPMGANMGMGIGGEHEDSNILIFCIQAYIILACHRTPHE